MSGNNLNKVQDEGVILSLIQGVKDNVSEVYIWRIFGGKKHLGLVRIESVRKLRNDFCIVPQEGQDKIVQELIGSLNFIDLYVPGYALLLRCNIRQTDAPSRYYLQIPHFVAQIERRISPRLNVQDESDIRVAFHKSVPPMKFQKSCFDISSGGVSFFVSRAESRYFKEEDEIKAMEIIAGKWSTNVAAQVTTITEVEPDEFNGLSYKAWRVSCRFTQIDQVSKKYLERFIFERIKDELRVINDG